MNINRKLASALTGLALILAMTVSPVSAWADQTITTQPYYVSSGIKALHAQGLNGAGVKIAVIDGPVDTSVPELRGVKVITKSFCTTKFEPASVAHATAIASILASPYYGWAPKATILNYTIATGADQPGDCDVNKVGDDLGFLIQQALNDGADVISISIEMALGIFASAAPFAMIRAVNLGVPVVFAAGNDNMELSDDSLASANTVISVGAIDGTGKKASYSNYGIGLNLMAYGGPPLTVRDPDKSGHLTVITKDRWGTSLAAPMVAGALALARQKWPKASGNQLERVLLDTADGVADHKGTWTNTMGSGILNAKLLVATDPSGYSNENPTLTKNEFAPPQAKDFQAYADGTLEPVDTVGDFSYVYRGCDPDVLAGPAFDAKIEPAPGCQAPTPAPFSPEPTPIPTTTTPTPPTNDSSSGIPWLPAGAVAGILMIVVVVVGIVAVTRRKHETPPSPSAQQAWQVPQQPIPPHPGGPPAGHTA